MSLEGSHHLEYNRQALAPPAPDCATLALLSSSAVTAGFITQYLMQQYHEKHLKAVSTQTHTAWAVLRFRKSTLGAIYSGRKQLTSYASYTLEHSCEIYGHPSSGQWPSTGALLPQQALAWLARWAPLFGPAHQAYDR